MKTERSGTIVQTLWRLLAVGAVLLFACTGFSEEDSNGENVQVGTPEISVDTLDAIRSRLSTNETDEAISLANSFIDQLEEEWSRFDPILVEPLLLLGDGLRKNGEYVDALDTYDRARHVSRLAHGLHSIEQLDAVYREADTYHELGQIGRATDRHEYAYGINIRSHGEDAVELLPGLFELAEWYLEVRNVFAARGLFDDALKITKENLERTDPNNIRALKGLAMSYRHERFTTPGEIVIEDEFTDQSTSADENVPTYKAEVNRFAPGEEALKELVEIEQERTASTVESLAYTKLDLADWYLLFDKVQLADVVYRDIWAMFVDESNAQFLRKEFSEPMPLYYPLARSPEPQPQADLVEPIEGTIELKFSVDSEGLVTDVSVESVAPDDRFVEEFVAAMEEARYRPVMRDGQRTSRDGVILTHEYIFFPDVNGGE
ncbi:MAG: TonB family protein [Gammaproteobacteria bacterium]|nr:TonB family protein [Gammaproteobacteria bacterium]